MKDIFALYLYIYIINEYQQFRQEDEKRRGQKMEKKN